LPASVTRIEYQGREFFVIGTAHVSQRSVTEVEQLIRTVRPDTVCVELDANRLAGLTDPQRFRAWDIRQALREGKLPLLTGSLALASYQRRIGQRLGVRPGAEMIAAVEQAKTVGAKLVLADREAQVTLRRTWASLSVSARVQLVVGLAGSLVARQEVSAEQVEALKERDTMGELLANLAEAMPSLKTPLIDERDRYLISSVRECAGQRVVAVVGAGHVSGMLRSLFQPVDRAALETLPSQRGRPLRAALRSLVLFLFWLSAAQAHGAIIALWAWVLPTAILGAVAVLLARGAIGAVLAAALTTPITALHPALGAGVLPAWLQIAQNPPTQEDRLGLAQLTTLSTWYQNRFTRVLLVFSASRIGAALGALVSAVWFFVLSLTGR
jgi:pheromone shutdown-related protein TraB